MLKQWGMAALVVGAFAGAAGAGPWTPQRGHGQLIVTFAGYETREVFTESRDRSRFTDDGRFRKVEVNPYFELGLSDRVTFIGNTFLVRSEFSNAFGAQSNRGLGDSTIGLRYRMTGSSGPVLAAVQGLVKLPTASDGQPNLGNRQLDVDARLVLGGAIGGSSTPPFWSVEGGYRYRREGPADELRFEGTLGVYLHRRVMALGQAMVTRGLENNDQVLAELDPTLSPDYDLARVQGSVVLSLTAKTRVQGGAFVHAAGRNTGAGSGVLVALWQSF